MGRRPFFWTASASLAKKWNRLRLPPLCPKIENASFTASHLLRASKNLKWEKIGVLCLRNQLLTIYIFWSVVKKRKIFDSFHKDYISVTCSKKIRQLTKSNQSFWLKNILRAVLDQELPIFKKFVKMIRCFVVYINIYLGTSKIMGTQTGKPVLISLTFRAEIRNLVDFLRKIEIFWFSPEKTHILTYLKIFWI